MISTLEQKLESAEVYIEIYKQRVLNNLTSMSNTRNIEKVQEQQEIINDIKTEIDNALNSNKK